MAGRGASPLARADAVVTRFAPSPTGPLHLGHAYAAQVAQSLARASGGRYLLRIEDIDRQRSKPQWEAALIEDLTWLGLAPDAPPLRQSDREDAYGAALNRLWEMGLLYPCNCTRRDIEAALSAPQEGAPLLGPDGPIYPGTCRPRHANRPEGPRPKTQHLRLDMERAVDLLAARKGATHSALLSFTETGAGPKGETGEITLSAKDLLSRIGDVVVARRDFGTSYHLSVVVDDAAQGVTLVSRGADLFEATPIHVLLQHLLDLPVPRYHHHPLVRDANGKRLAKRDDAKAIARYRAEGLSPEAVLDLAKASAR